MSKKIPKNVDFTFSEAPSLMDMSLIESELNDITDASQMPEGLPTSAGDQVPDEVDLQIEQKEEIQEEDIFDMAPTKTAKKIKKDKELQDDIEELEQSISKPAVKHKRKRKPMSAEHLAKLALAREKAQIARKAKKEEREQALKLEKEQKDLLKKVKQKRVSKLKKEVEQSDSEGEETPKGKGKSMGLTQADLEEAQYQAILKYDSMRKAQKEEKRKQQMIEQEKQKMLNTINRATGQTYSYGARRSDGRLMNRFDNCY